MDLKPGEVKQVNIRLDQRAFSFYDIKRRDWNAEPGEFLLLVDASSDDIRLKGSFTLSH